MSDKKAISVYYARAMDGLPSRAIQADADVIRQLLADAGMSMLDTYLSTGDVIESPLQSDSNISGLIVENDLALLRTADAVLMDLSIPNRSYVGCLCELVYAYQIGTPVVVNVGATDLGNRHWLRYHATAITNSIQMAITKLRMNYPGG